MKKFPIFCFTVQMQAQAHHLQTCVTKARASSASSVGLQQVGRLSYFVSMGSLSLTSALNQIHWLPLSSCSEMRTDLRGKRKLKNTPKSLIILLTKEMNTPEKD